MTEPPPSGPEARLVRRALAFGAAAGLIGLSLGPAIGLSVLGGSAITTMNLVFLRRLVGGLTAVRSARSAILLAVFTGGRYLLLGAFLVVIIRLWNADVIGVVCGLGAPLLAVLLELGGAGRGAFRAPPERPGTPPSPNSPEVAPEVGGSAPSRPA